MTSRLQPEDGSPYKQCMCSLSPN